MRSRREFVLVIMVAAIASFDTSSSSVFPNAAEPPPFRVRLTDVTVESGIDFKHENSPTTRKYLIETMGGGVGLLDYDNDGWLDVFFTNGAPLTDPMPAGARPVKSDRFANRLYRNNHDGTFADVTRSAGVGGVGTGGY